MTQCVIVFGNWFPILYQIGLTATGSRANGSLQEPIGRGEPVPGKVGNRFPKREPVANGNLLLATGATLRGLGRVWLPSSCAPNPTSD